MIQNGQDLIVMKRKMMNKVQVFFSVLVPIKPPIDEHQFCFYFLFLGNKSNGVLFGWYYSIFYSELIDD